MAGLPTGTVTFLFTDIEGSTRLLQELGDAEYSRVLADHQHLVRAAFRSRGGYEVETQGDAFFFAFPTAVEAVAAATDAQRALAEHPWPDPAAVHVRMGLHTGQPIVAAGRYVGLDVHRAARICSIGHGGQVLLSQTTRSLAIADLPDGVELRDLGERRLKDLRRPEQIFQLTIPGMPETFPSLRTLDSRPNNLPIQPTPLIGRERDLAEIRNLLTRQNARILTLTGSGGIGKTRLALQAAADLIEEIDDGVFFVDLAVVPDADLVIPAVAQALKIKEATAQTVLDSVRGFLSAKRILLILDNFEHVLEATPQVADLLRTCPAMQLLVTSRASLHLRGEKEYPVSPLAVPDDKSLASVDRFSEFPAIELFIQRASDSRPDFAVTLGNAPAIVGICRRLDGLPLAIELAAARTSILSPQALLARLDRRLPLLTRGPRDAPARQQTLRRTIDWSYDLLEADEQRLFRRLAVFVGGSTLEAIEAVCALDDLPQAELLDGVASLVSKSLLRRVDEPSGDIRFRMFETIREYALERLRDTEEVERLRSAHAEYFVSFSQEAEPKLQTSEQKKWLDRLEAESGNLRVAIEHCLAQPNGEGALLITGSVWRLWAIRGPVEEGRLLLARAIERGQDGPPDMLARAFAGAGDLARIQGDYDTARVLSEKSLGLFRQSQNPAAVALLLHNLGSLLVEMGDAPQAEKLLEESLAIRRKLGDPGEVAHALNGLAEVLRARGNFQDAGRLYEESLALRRQDGNPMQLAIVLVNLGHMRARAGDLQRALTHFRESLTIFRAISSKRGQAESLAGLAAVSAMAHDPDRAARLLGAAESAREAAGSVMAAVDRAEFDRNVSATKAHLSEEEFQKLRNEGRAMALEQAVEYALSERG